MHLSILVDGLRTLRVDSRQISFEHVILLQHFIVKLLNLTILVGSVFHFLAEKLDAVVSFDNLLHGLLVLAWSVHCLPTVFLVPYRCVFLLADFLLQLVQLQVYTIECPDC